MRTRILGLLTLLCLLPPIAVAGQRQTPPQTGSARGGRAPVEKIREGVYRVGAIEVDIDKREARVEGRVNKGVTTLEFVANTKNGAKAYESALTVMTDATSFNVAVLLLGLVPAHATVPKKHFDPIPPKGDPVEVWVEWKAGSTVKRIRIEQLLYDKRTKTTLPEGPWVYTGSTFFKGKYMAEVDGVLIGFVHSPSPVIENPRAGAVGAYGSVELNTRIGLDPDTHVTLIVKALGPSLKRKL